jgi:uncharacterized protein
MHGTDGLIQKKQRAISVLSSHRGVLIALSGGVDSAALLAIASEAIDPDQILSVTGRSPAVTEDEIRDAELVAKALGVEHLVVDTFEIERPEYRANSGDRCFHCRSELFGVLLTLAAQKGIPAVAYGAIVDDLGDHRPGMDAARQLGILAPLLDAGIGKEDARAIALQHNLHIHEKPASACLASRIPIGTEVTPERLDQVRRAEAALRTLGFRRLRVRHHDDLARIELGGDEIDRIANPSLRAEIVGAIKGAGFRYVVVDLAGYRASGLELEGLQPLYSIRPSRDSGQ